MNHHDLSPLERARFNMIEQQIRPWNVLDARVLQLLSDLPRENFVPPAHKSLAFMDIEIPLSAPANSAPAMLAPKVEARMLQDLQLTGSESVLEIGTGSGYFAAMLARLAKHVTTLELDAALAEQASANLRAAVVVNANVKVQDGSKIDRIQGDFDVIVLSGSVARIPDELTAKLKMGGRIAAIVGGEPVMRFTLITRTPTGLVTTQPWDTFAPRLQGFPELARFTF